MEPVREDLTEVHIHVGGVFASRTPSRVRTVLGSCVAVCLFDAHTRVGGMNHFMLPVGHPQPHEDISRYGIHAMELLITAIHRAGGDRRRLTAKLFGGGNVLGTGNTTTTDVGRSNIDFIERFMVDEDFPVVARDLAGTEARQLRFHTDTGRAFVKRLGPNVLARQTRAEQVYLQRPLAERLPEGSVTLF